MNKQELILRLEAIKLLVDKEMHEAGKQQDEKKYAVQSELLKNFKKHLIIKL